MKLYLFSFFSRIASLPDQLARRGALSQSASSRASTEEHLLADSPHRFDSLTMSGHLDLDDLTHWLGPMDDIPAKSFLLAQVQRSAFVVRICSVYLRFLSY